MTDQDDHDGGAGANEETTVMPETAAELVELEQLRLKLAEAEERSRNHWDQYLRTAAEFENYRRRIQRELDAARSFAVERFAQELLGVKDSLDLAVQNAPRADAAALATGQEATLSLLSRAFEKAGISEIDPAGEPFDPARHEAMLVQPSGTAAPDSVLTVVQKGYELNGRLLRPARVIVAGAPAG
ncbi:MAG: nucleotide exchange factor GrpE [Gammaproteobacteria bacterium]|nr:nucleotide exchange factor GrpE [Gammaproteobacteria bacterium]